jgi:hypothetical protein
VTQPSEAPVAKLESLAGFRPVVARLSARVQRPSSLQALGLKVNPINDAARGKEKNFSLRIGVTTIDGFRALFVIEAGCNNKSSNC